MKNNLESYCESCKETTSWEYVGRQKINRDRMYLYNCQQCGTTYTEKHLIKNMRKKLRDLDEEPLGLW